MSIEDFDGALDEIVADCMLSLQKTYDRAVETSGDVHMRKSVMEALATLNDTWVPFKRIRESFMDLHPGRYKDAKELNFLSTALKPLKEDYGILIDKGLPRSKNNAWSFTNPLMRAYVNLRALQERQQQFDLDSVSQTVVKAPQPGNRTRRWPALSPAVTQRRYKRATRPRGTGSPQTRSTRRARRPRWPST